MYCTIKSAQCTVYFKHKGKNIHKHMQHACGGVSLATHSTCKHRSTNLTTVKTEHRVDQSLTLLSDDTTLTPVENPLTEVCTATPPCSPHYTS